MSGYFTPGVASPTAASYTLPVPQGCKVPVDTDLASGQNPQSIAPTVQQLLASPFGKDVSGDSALTDGATITMDCSKTSYGYVTLGGSRNLVLTNMVAGQRVRLAVTQDGTGSRTLTPSLSGATLKTSGTPLSTAASSLDIVELYTPDGATLYYYSVAKAFS